MLVLTLVEKTFFFHSIMHKALLLTATEIAIVLYAHRSSTREGKITSFFLGEREVKTEKKMHSGQLFFQAAYGGLWNSHRDWGLYPRCTGMMAITQCGYAENI